MTPRRLPAFFAIFFLFFFTLLKAVDAQQVNPSSINTMNFSNAHVDDMSDDQIRQFMLQVRQTGLSDEQIAQVALAKGMNPAELQKLRNRVLQIRQKDMARAQKLGVADTGRLRQAVFSTGADSTDTLLTQVADALDALQPKIFGSELFRNNHITFEPDLRIPTPSNYQLGPEDELIVDIYGYSQAHYDLTISNEGSVNIPYVGIVYLSGLSMAEATQRIQSKLSEIYAAIRSGKTKVQVSLGRIRSISVTIMGEVVKPGTYTLSSLATVFNALYASGGPSETGSFRDIEVIRNSRVIDTVDVYDFLLNGDQSRNIRLQDQDVIRVPVYRKRVEIGGEVKRPAIYEMQPGESVADLLRYAGGFTDKAYQAVIKVVRNTGTQKRVADVQQENFASFEPQSGDKYTVGAILNRYANRVSITGAVYRPGPYALTDTLTLRKLIVKADGLREDAFLKRGTITRLNSDMTTSLIPFDVSAIVKGTTPDIDLQREDSVVIKSIFDLRDQYTVRIGGEVRDSGKYHYSDSMTVADLIQMAGGFKEGATPQHIEISRRVYNSNVFSTSATMAQIFDVNVNADLSLENPHFMLRPFDVVEVRPAPGYAEQKQVTIKGEVLYPGIYTLSKKNERVSDLVARAGGLTAFAYADGTSLRRENRDENKDLENQKTQSFLRLQALAQKGVDTTRASQEVLAQVRRNNFVGIRLDKILTAPGSKYDLILKEGDVLTVPVRLQTVKVNGEVLYPVTAVFRKRKPLRYYISQAGGFSNSAKKGRVYVVYANGFVKSTNHILFFKNYPHLEPGAEIFVPAKPERRRLTPQEIFGIGSGATALTAAIITILNLIK